MLESPGLTRIRDQLQKLLDELEHVFRSVNELHSGTSWAIHIVLWIPFTAVTCSICLICMILGLIMVAISSIIGDPED
jgi:type III secretory pathway component EscR